MKHKSLIIYSFILIFLFSGIAFCLYNLFIIFKPLNLNPQEKFILLNLLILMLLLLELITFFVYKYFLKIDNFRWHKIRIRMYFCLILVLSFIYYFIWW